ncbi:hypothetical protein [Caldanaerobius polysaccharolyticus]|uniref:hypothetical protein n=1 Tax=Caldanaerobius polysaccharolyticus TaxID=44256 RepID=UPI00047A8BD7|nr:hypothetical protein [Caldanaerobius polysaccharolyticus]
MLTKRLAVYIPSKCGQDEIPASTRQFWLKTALRTLAEIYGGATTIEGQGAWLSENGDIVTEHVTIAYAYTDETADVSPVYELAKRLCKALRQEAVAVEIGHGLDFVTAADDTQSAAV